MKYRAIRVPAWLAVLTVGFVLNAAMGPAARADAALAVAYQSWGLCADYATPAEAENCAMRMCQAESRANSNACEIIFACDRGGFGALAASPDSELLGAACGHFSPESAAASAIKQCTDGGPGCGVVAQWQDYKGADPAVVPKGIE
ncbi:MAG: DUF4189 domain-containing protein [Proteobacteria bacterium]|nr:DUF4189 domain-containing protein [Pseudomonadota bacterium]